MPIVKINQLPEGSGNLSGDDVFVFMDDPSGASITKKIPLSELISAIGSISSELNTGDITFSGSTISTLNNNQNMTITTNGSGDIYIGADRNMIFDMNAFSGKGILIQDSQEDGYDDSETPSTLRVGSIYHDTGTMVIRSDGNIVDASGNILQSYGGVWITNGDQTGFRVPPPTGVDGPYGHTVTVSNDGLSWNFNIDGTLTLPNGGTLGFMGEGFPALYNHLNVPVVVAYKNVNTDQDTSQIVLGSSISSDNGGLAQIIIANSDGGSNYWNFKDDGYLQTPGNISLPNSTILATGTFDNSTGGNNGISLVCAVGYELNWQGGHLKCTQDNGISAANIYCDSAIEFPGSETNNMKINSSGLIFPNNAVQTSAGIPSNTGLVPNSTSITNIVSISQANYDAIVTKDPNTLYVIS